MHKSCVLRIIFLARLQLQLHSSFSRELVLTFYKYNYKNYSSANSLRTNVVDHGNAQMLALAMKRSKHILEYLSAKNYMLLALTKRSC